MKLEKIVNKAKKSLRNLAYAGLVGLALAGGWGEAKGDLINSNSKVVDNIEYYMEISKPICNPGEEVQISYRVTNQTANPLTFNFKNQVSYYFKVTKNNTIIWYNMDGESKAQIDPEIISQLSNADEVSAIVGLIDDCPFKFDSSLSKEENYQIYLKRSQYFTMAQEPIIRNLSPDEFDVKNRFHIFNGFSGSMTKKGLDKLKLFEEVIYIEPDSQGSANGGVSAGASATAVKANFESLLSEDTFFSLELGESREYHQLWNLTDNQGSTVSQGSYEITGSLHPLLLLPDNKEQYVPLSVQIEIIPESSTIALLGTGLLGLSTYTKRKK